MESTEIDFKLLREIEKQLFEPSLNFFNDKGGYVVVDDELISSWTKDVERKTLSCRKRGKEGPVADCVADLSNNKVFGTRLCAKGESDLNNMQQLWIQCLTYLLTSSPSTVTSTEAIAKGKLLSHWPRRNTRY